MYFGCPDDRSTLRAAEGWPSPTGLYVAVVRAPRTPDPMTIRLEAPTPQTTHEMGDE